MRTQLPLEPDELHTWDDIRLIDDDTRKQYAKTVAFAQRCMPVFDDDDAGRVESIYHLATRKPLGMLQRYQVTDTTIVHLEQAGDIVSAFYVPTDLRWVQLIINDVLLGEWKGCSRPLSDILEAARTGPATDTHCRLADILAMARSVNKRYVHRQHPTMVVDGVKYRRLEAVQPFLPMIRLWPAIVAIAVSEPCIFFVESTNVRHHDRVMLLDDAAPLNCYYVEGQRLGIVTMPTGGWHYRFNCGHPIRQGQGRGNTRIV